ncbi:uncharacterized protein LOC117589964 [Drosophila guanche]|uniref:uncharacterized protein LOC117589964 n=1 Tax=Drosophila guanche TaxID=7266 RepID=UPI001471FD84|nr:uncharacterized protein LOC117589964 [Drosophila guanche]
MNILIGVLSSFLLAPILLASGQTGECDFRQAVDTGQSFYFRSPRYPEKYTPGTKCQMQATSSFANNKLILTCQIDIPRDPNGCINNKFVVKRYHGDGVLQSTNTYCGKRQLSETSYSRTNYAQIHVDFSSSGSKTGRFSCTLSASN